MSNKRQERGILQTVWKFPCLSTADRSYPREFITRIKSNDTGHFNSN